MTLLAAMVVAVFILSVRRHGRIDSLLACVLYACGLAGELYQARQVYLSGRVDCEGVAQL